MTEQSHLTFPEKDSSHKCFAGHEYKDITFDRFNFSFADLQVTKFRECTFSRCNFKHAFLSGAYFKNCEFRECTFDRAVMNGTDFHNTDFESVFMTNATINATFYTCSFHLCPFNHSSLGESDFFNSKLNQVTFQNADLSCALLRYTNSYVAVDLSGATGLIEPSDWMAETFEATEKGYLVYKAIGQTTYPLSPNWVIEPGQYLKENCNSNRFEDCGCGVNFGTLGWIHKNYETSLTYHHINVWQCLIEWADLPGVVVPYLTRGKARCSRLKLLSDIGKDS